MKAEREACTVSAIAQAIEDCAEEEVVIFANLDHCEGEPQQTAEVQIEDGHGIEGCVGEQVYSVCFYDPHGLHEELEGPFESATRAAQEILERYPLGVSYTEP